MESATDILVQQVLVPVILATAAALGAWVVSKLPGPIRDALTSAAHAHDVALIGAAIERRAAAITAGAIRPTSAPTDIATYVRRALPDTLDRVQPTDEALRTMSVAALHKAAAAAPIGGLPVEAAPLS